MRVVKQMWVVALLAAVLVGTSSKASAAQIPLSGGDAVDGWVAPSSVLFAYAIGSATDQSIQGINFEAWDVSNNPAPTYPSFAGSVTRNTTTAYGSVGITYGGSADDVAMGAMITQGFYRFASITFTITGLTADASYRVDAFTRSGDTERAGTTYTFNGVTTDTFTLGALNSWLVQNTIAANGSGNIVLTVATPGDNAILSGLAVSAIPTPEPSGLILLSLGGVLMFIRRRKRSSR